MARSSCFPRRADGVANVAMARKSRRPLPTLSPAVWRILVFQMYDISKWVSALTDS